MELAQFDKKIMEIKKKNPILFELERDKCVEDEQIDKVENFFHINLSKQYKNFVKKYGGGYFGFTTILSCDPSGNFYLVNNISSEWVNQHGFLPLFDFETGDFGGIKTDSGILDENIYIYLHETNNIIEEKIDFFQAVLKYGFKMKNIN